MITLYRNPHSIRVTLSGKHITTARKPTQLMDALLATRSMDANQARRWIIRARALPIGTAINLNTIVPKPKPNSKHSTMLAY